MLKCIRKLNCFKQQDLDFNLDLYTSTCTDLEHITYKDTIPFILPILYGKVIKVYDGDTITIASIIPNINNNKTIYRLSVRLTGIDSPELKGHTPNEKNAAVTSRDALHKLIFGKIIELRNNSNEKYGRILADVYLTNTNTNTKTLLHVNKWMLDNKYAIPYNGGTKQKFNESNEGVKRLTM
jgi:endonuclease YncB( thermonuclease family)